MKRTLKKTASYAVMHLCVAVAVAYALTGNLVIALSIGLIEPAVQTIFFALHERVWDRKAKTAPPAPLAVTAAAR
ncbi:MAG: hypothetical protein Kilf2KO_09140 [Rhodospirillales bacterium]